MTEWVACPASDRQGSNFESYVQRRVLSHSYHHPDEVLLAQFSLYVHKGALKPHPFIHSFTHSFIHSLQTLKAMVWASKNTKVKPNNTV